MRAPPILPGPQPSGPREFKPCTLNLTTLPTHSPDLTPLDTNMFGTVKAEWNRKSKAGRLDWAQSCELALQLLRDTNPDSYVEEMKLRWQACRDVGGGHVEARLKVLKKEKKK